jgi:AraC-like DNA-binding protein
VNPTLERADLRYWRLDPDPRLRPGILCYFVALPAPKASALPPVCEAELLLPDGYSEIVFSLSNRFERWGVNERTELQTVCSSYVIGGRSHSVLTRALGDLCIIGVKLESHVLRNLAGVPLATFRDSILPLRDLNQAALLQLEEALADASSVVQIAALLDQFFLHRRESFCVADPLVRELMRCIRIRQGNVPILRWIRACGVDQRYFERRFCAWTGMTPKRFARIVRFKHSYHRFLHGEASRGATGRHLDDYYDQSHFHRDFKYFMGVAPSLKLKRQMNQGTEITEHLMELTMRAEVTGDG